MCGLQNGLAVKRTHVSGPDGTFALSYRVTASEWLSQNLAIESFWSALLHLSMQYADRVCPSVHPDPAVRELMVMAEMMSPGQSMQTEPARDVFDRSQSALLKRAALCRLDTNTTQPADSIPPELRPYGEWEPVTEDNLPVIGEEVLRYVLPTDEDAGSRLLPYEYCVVRGPLPNGTWFRRTAAYRECLMLLQPHRAVCYDLNDLVQIFVSACALNGNKSNKVTQQWLGQQWARFDSVLIPVFGSASVIGFVSADSRMAIPLHVAAELIRVNDTNVFIDDRRPLLDAPLSTVIQFSGENYATKAKIFAMYENIALLWARHIAGQCVDTTR